MYIYSLFIVLYNGTAPYPDKTVLRLSDAFEGAVKTVRAVRG
jgi:hypothetical protein